MAKKPTVEQIAESIQDYDKKELERLKYIVRKELKGRKVTVIEPPKN
jgi:hypothetical protein